MIGGEPGGATGRPEGAPGGAATPTTGRPEGGAPGGAATPGEEGRPEGAPGGAATPTTGRPEGGAPGGAATPGEGGRLEGAPDAAATPTTGPACGASEATMTGGPGAIVATMTGGPGGGSPRTGGGADAVGGGADGSEPGGGVRMPDGATDGGTIGGSADGALADTGVPSKATSSNSRSIQATRTRTSASIGWSPTSWLSERTPSKNWSALASCGWSLRSPTATVTAPPVRITGSPMKAIIRRRTSAAGTRRSCSRYSAQRFPNGSDLWGGSSCA